jgi:uncharacterized protein YuzE
MKKKPVRLEYDKEADAAYVRLSRAKIAESEEVEPGLIVDVDRNNQIVGIEILRFAHRFAPTPRSNRKIAG